VFFTQKSSASLLGLDISSKAVKLLEISQKGKRYKVESFAVEPMPANAVVERTIRDVQAVADTIKRAVKRSGTRAKAAAVAVAGSAVITKVVTVPAGLTDDELGSQIELEADQSIPFPLEEVNLDYLVLGPSEKNPQMVDVLLTASRSENVDARVEAVELAGLTAKFVGVEAYALEAPFALIAQQMPGGGLGTVAVMDIGATMTTLNVLHNLKTIYTRDQIFGGKQLTEAIQQRYGLSMAEAGKAKKMGGLSEEYLTEVQEPFKEAMAQQVSRSLQFFFSSSQSTRVDQIILAGGCANMPGAAALIEGKTGIPTSIANPFADMSLSARIDPQALGNDASAMMIACGLALRRYATQPQINLLLWREALRKERQQQFMVAAIGGLLITGGLFYSFHNYVDGQIEAQNGRNEYLQQQIAEVDKKIKEVASLEAEKAKLLARMSVIQELQASRPQVVHLFDELVRTLPEGIHLAKAERKGQVMTLEGVAESYARVSALMNNLEKSDWFAGPKLEVVQTSAKDKTRISRFVLQVSVLPKPKGRTATESPS
jgi:type IV pilus assembly protein PilM